MKWIQFEGIGGRSVLLNVAIVSIVQLVTDGDGWIIRAWEIGQEVPEIGSYTLGRFATVEDAEAKFEQIAAWLDDKNAGRVYLV